MPAEESIRMSVEGLRFDPLSKTPIVVLRDEERKLTLPIWVGLLEATAMASELEGARVSRPLTHDLVRSILDSVEIQVESVEVNDLRDNTYFALVNLRQGDRSWSIDSRPSDAIALALRVKCPIWVAKHVLEQSSTLIQDGDEGPDQNLSDISPEKWAEILAKMGPDDFKYKM
ncbi:MAG: bifunctional nuclease family protein [bacterium]